MKRAILIGLMVLLVAVLAGGCAGFNAEVRGPLPKSNEVYVGETIVIHNGKPAEKEYAQKIIDAYKEGIRERLPEYGFKVLDKPGPNTLVLKTTIKDEFYFFGGFYTGGSVDAFTEIYQNGVLLPITLKMDGHAVSKFNRGTFNGTSYSGTAYVVRKHVIWFWAEKLKEHFNP